MKTVFTKCLALLLVITLYSCQTEDDGTIDVSIEGVWVLNALRIESSFDFNQDGNASNDLYQETECYNNDNIKFLEDGTVTIITALAYLFVDDNNMQQYQCQDSFEISSTWTRNGNTITVENDDFDIVGNISGNTLTIQIPDSFDLQVYDTNTQQIVEVEEDITIVYTKQ